MNSEEFPDREKLGKVSNDKNYLIGKFFQTKNFPFWKMSTGDTLAHFSHKSNCREKALASILDVNIAIGTSQYVLSGEIKENFKNSHFTLFFSKKRGGPKYLHHVNTLAHSH